MLDIGSDIVSVVVGFANAFDNSKKLRLNPIYSRYSRTSSYTWQFSFVF